MSTNLSKKKISLEIPENESLDNAEKDLDVLTQSIMHNESYNVWITRKLILPRPFLNLGQMRTPIQFLYLL